MLRLFLEKAGYNRKYGCDWKSTVCFRDASLFVAIIIIVNTLSMVALERTSEIE